MAQGMNKLNEALASLPEVRELLLSLDAGHVAHRRIGSFGCAPRAACRCRAAQDTALTFDRLRG